MGAATTALARCALAAQKPCVGPLWRRAPRTAQPGPPLAHTVPVCTPTCFPGVVLAAAAAADHFMPLKIPPTQDASTTLLCP